MPEVNGVEKGGRRNEQYDQENHAFRIVCNPSVVACAAMY